MERFIRSILISMNKKCPKCRSVSTKKDGRRNGRQSYKCKDCGHVFQNSRRDNGRVAERLFSEYSERKQTVSELSERTEIPVRTVRRKLDGAFSSKKGAESS